MKTHTLLTLFLCLFLVVVSTVAMAQPLPPAPNPSAGAPFDTFVMLLIITGFVYGAKKLKTNRAAVN